MSCRPLTAESLAILKDVDRAVSRFFNFGLPEVFFLKVLAGLVTSEVFRARWLVAFPLISGKFGTGNYMLCEWRDGDFESTARSSSPKLVHLMLTKTYFEALHPFRFCR